MKIPRVSILEVKINPLNMEIAAAQLSDWIRDRQKAYVCVVPAHSVMECVNDPGLLPIFNDAGLSTPDGMSIVWLLKAMGFKQTQRVYGPDLLKAACEHGLKEDWKHYFFGGAPGIAQELGQKLIAQYPDLAIVGCFSPPFGRPNENEDKVLVDAINASGADILWVGMSSPWQEIWMHEHLGRINAPVMIGVGAAFDFLTGNKKQAPLWMQRSGLEWLFRFIEEPKRLWPRYKQYPRFVFLALRELISRDIDKRVE